MPRHFNFTMPLSSNPPLMASSMELIQERQKHELAIFRFRDHEIDFDSVRPGNPINMSLFGEQGQREFYGYVHHVKPSFSPGIAETVVAVIGATYVLKAAAQTIYKNVTASDVVRQIAQKHGLSFNVDDHPRVYDQIIQAGMTDLQLMHKLARQCGYTLRLLNTELHFHPVTKLFDEQRQSAHIFSRRDARNPAGSTLYSFKLTAGEDLEQDGEYKSAAAVSGIDAKTKTLHQVTNQNRPKSLRGKKEYEFFDRFLQVTAPDFQAAQYEAKAADERTRFPYRAVVEVLGTPTIHPDAPVYLEGLGPEYSGYWIVLKATHRVESESIHRHRYITVLEVGSDSLGSTNMQNSGGTDKPNTAATRVVDKRTAQINTKPKTILKKGIVTPAAKKGPTGFGKIGNRTKPPVAKKTVTAPTWKGVSNNLKTPPKSTSNKSAVIVAKQRSAGGK